MYIECEDYIAEEISDYFTFYAKNYKHTPLYKNNLWDGKIRLFKTKRRLLYIGLLKELIKFCRRSDIKIKLDESMKSLMSEQVDMSFIKEYNFPFDLYDYQEHSIKISLEKKRAILLSATSSGKSAIIYSVVRRLQELGKKVLVLISTTGLVEQIYQDFQDYGWDSEKFCNKIYDYKGMKKDSEKPIYISTWQSIYKEPPLYFEQFDAVIVDEVHEASATSISSILEKSINAEYKLGYTGTLDESKTNEIKLNGLFGPTYLISKTKELMDREIISPLNINVIVLEYPDKIKKRVSKLSYFDEIDYIVGLSDRDNIIANLASKLEKNTLVLFYRKKHGKQITELIKKKVGNDKQVFYIDGDIDVSLRESYRQVAEKNNNVIIVASYKTFATGTNIKNLWNVLFAHPYKAKVKNLQSIGRALRKLVNVDNNATLYDFIDAFGYGHRKNTTYNHGLIRLKLYKNEEFNYKIKRFPVNVK
jgi:superfamily II DNA or RNA helicase